MAVEVLVGVGKVAVEGVVVAMVVVAQVAVV